MDKQDKTKRCLIVISAYTPNDSSSDTLEITADTDNSGKLPKLIRNTENRRDSLWARWHLDR